MADSVSEENVGRVLTGLLAALTVAGRERLLASRSPGIKALASKIWAAEASPRAEVVARYQAALKLVGTAAVCPACPRKKPATA